MANVMKKIFGFGLLLAALFGTFFANPALAQTEITLLNIAITTPASKLDYVVGDALDLSGLVVTGTYSDDSTQVETITQANVSGFDNSAPATGQVLTVTVAEKTATYTIDINVAPEEDPHFLAEENIILDNGCAVESADGATHIFPENNSSGEYLAICALQEALEQEFVNEIEFVDFGFGLFVNSINGISEENTYWKLNHNGSGVMVGAAALEVAAGDTVSLQLTEFDPVTFEETPRDYTLTLTISSLNPIFYNIVLPNRCSVTDTSGLVHEFPESGSPSDFLAICVLQEALEQHFIDDIDFMDFGFGLFVDNFNNITKQENSYWQFQLNGSSASAGATQVATEKGSVVSFVLTLFDPETFEESPAEPVQSFSIRVIDLENLPQDDEPEEETGGNGGSGGGGTPPPSSFSTTDALNYLKNVQGEDGSFGEDMYTDWAAVAFGAANASGSSKATLINYFAANNSLSSLLTDNERRAMALLALDKNPYSFEGVNYIKAITETFDGTQFGDDDLVNDDIFALIPLKNSGYGDNEEMISKSVAFVVSKQSGNGSWVGSVDITAAAVQALKPFESLPGVSDALLRAAEYLRSKQGGDGGWENSVFSTSWAMQAESALNASWSQNGKSGLDYLAVKQTNANNGGSVLSSSENGENNIWATSYAIAAASGKTWREIMDTVSKPKVTENQNEENDKEEETREEPELQSPVEPVAVACAPGDLFNITTGEPCAPNLALNTISLPANEITIAPATETALSANVNASSVSKKETKKITEEEISAPVLTAAAIESLPAPENTPKNIPLVVGTTTGLMFLLLGLKFLLL